MFRIVIAFLLRSNHLLISWLQSPSTMISEIADLGEICHCFHIFPFYLPWSDGTGCHHLSFLILSFKLAFSLSSFTLNKRLFSSSLLSAIRVVLSAYLWLLIFLLAIMIPVCNKFNQAFLMMCSAYKLNKGDSKQPCHTPFSTLNQSVVPYKVLIVASCPVYRFLRRQVTQSDIPSSLSVSTVCYYPCSQKL